MASSDVPVEPKQSQVVDPTQRTVKGGRRILVAVDEGEHSIYALQWVADNFLVRSPHDHVLVLYAKSTHSTLAGPAFVLTSEAINCLESYDQHVISQIKAEVDRICREKQVEVEFKMLTGDARDVITETANKIKPDVLVLGSHGFGPIKRAFLGSVSDYCVHHVKCPVVIVKNPAE